MRAELAVAAGAELGEGPVLFPDGSLWWVDLLEGIVYRWTEGGNDVVARFPHEISKALPEPDGAVILGRTSLLRIDSTGAIQGEQALHTVESNLRCSDGIVLPDGSIAFGVVDRDLAPGHGYLIQRSRLGKIHTVVENTTIANGIAVLADQSRVAWVDSPTQRVDVFDLDPHTGHLVERRPWFEVPEYFGVPDGLCADRAGGVWIAMWGGSAVVRFDEGGSPDAIVDVGVPHVTSCAFDRDDALIITTAAVLMTPQERDQNPGAGGLWVVPATTHGAQGAVTYVASGP